MSTSKKLVKDEMFLMDALEIRHFVDERQCYSIHNFVHV